MSTDNKNVEIRNAELDDDQLENAAGGGGLQPFTAKCFACGSTVHFQSNEQVTTCYCGATVKRPKAK